MDPYLDLYIEVIASFFGAVCVLLTLKQNIWCWPTGLVQVTLYVWVFFQARLYSDMGLHVVYVLMQFYGWYYWLRGGENRTRAEVVTMSNRERAVWAGVAAVGTGALGAAMSAWTDATLPFWDAATTVLSLIAQWLMAQKKLESWLIWLSVDVLCVGIYAVKGLAPTMTLYGMFLIMASMGFMEWRKSYLAEQAA